MRVKFIAFYTPEVAHYAEPNAELIKQYCERWGHTYDIETDPGKIYSRLEGRAIFWAYFPMLFDNFGAEGVDWLVKMDLDARIIDPNIDIATWMPPEHDLVYSTDIGPDVINAGVQLIRNCKPCQRFYQRAWAAGQTVARGQFLQGIFHEQSVLSAAVALHDAPMPRIHVVPHDFPHSFNDFAIHPTTFVLHDLSKGKGVTDMGCRCRLHDVPAPAPAPTSLKISPNAPLRVVYYVYLVNNWRGMMHGQLARLAQSGLAKACAEVWLVTCGSEEDGTAAQELASRLLPADKLKTWHQTGNQFELPGIRKVHELASEGECKILYLHTKGVSNQFTDFSSGKVCPRKVSGAADWRRFMQYFLIDRWKDCVALLDSNDVVAAFINPNNNWPHGNFWWTTSAHVKTCASPGGGDRWSYEAWLTTKGRPGKYHSFTHNEFDFHTSDHPSWLYDGTQHGQHLRIVSATYGSPDVQIDEGRPGVVGQPVQVDVAEQVRNLVQSGRRLDFRVDNQLFCDPCFGVRKRLSIVWSTLEDPDTHYLLDQDEGSTVKLELP